MFTESELKYLDSGFSCCHITCVTLVNTYFPSLDFILSPGIQAGHSGLDDHSVCANSKIIGECD